jgi:hypothetical protein
MLRPYAFITAVSKPIQRRETEAEYFHRVAAERRRVARDRRRDDRRARGARAIRRLTRPHG